MNLELTGEQVALRDTVRRFLAERAPIRDHVRPLLDDAVGTTEAVWHGLADLGATGALVPLEYGGAGMTMADAGIVAEELGAALHPGPWLSSAVAVPRALARLVGSQGHVAKLLTGIADGSAIAAIGPLESGHGAVAAAERGPGVTDVVLRGEITMPDAAAASVLLVLAEDRAGTGLFAVETDSAGVSVTLERGIDQSRKRFRVGFDDATAQRLASPSTEAIAAMVDDVLIATAADALGAARAVMQLTLEYARTREQFGQPIGSFQAIQHLCADMYETVELARSGVIHALWAADACPVDADADERHLSAVRAKAFAGRLAAVGDTAIQIFGGIGYTWEHDAHLYLRRLLNWSVYSGGPDRYLTELGAQLAGRCRKATGRAEYWT